MFPVHERLGRRKLIMMHGLSPLHTPPALMLYSGALSIASHNRVDANATTGAPQQGQKNRAPFRGIDRLIQPYLPRAGAHDGERPFERHRSRCSRLRPTGAGAGNNIKPVASEFPAPRG